MRAPGSITIDMKRSLGMNHRVRTWSAHALHAGAKHMITTADMLTEMLAAAPHPVVGNAAVSDPASRDPLTGFLNRTSFVTHVENALQNASRTGSVCSVVQVDIDQFSALNASHGHQIGDEVLLEVGQRISDALRPSDVVARLRRDEFVIVCELDASGGQRVHATDIGQRIHRSMDRAVTTSTGDIRVTVAIGTTSVAGDDLAESTPQRLMQEADTAATQASRKGRAQLIAFDATMHQQAAERYRTEHELRVAIRGQKLGVHYQPFYNLHSGGIVGVEALARWSHPDMGPISPGLFIPVAEESGLIDELGAWVMNTAIAQAAQWARTPGVTSPGRELLCTINLSSRQLLDPLLIEHVTAALEAAQLAATSVCFEITESVVMSDVAASMNILGELKDLGVVLAIDDFGTGYSSLSYLRRLPVDVLKIDMSFVQSVYNRDDRMITRAIIDLAHTLGMTTVAEGVESMLQVEILDALECDMAQGYLLHYPSSADDVSFNDLNFSEELNNERADATPPNTGRVLPL